MHKYISLKIVLSIVLLLAGMTLFLKANMNTEASLVINASCEDADDGRNYEQRGTVNYLDRDEGTRFTFTDHCNFETDEPDTLTEFYCDGNIYKYKEYRCPNGCSKGVCIGDKQVFAALDHNADKIVNIQEAAPVASRVWGMVGKSEKDIGFDASFDANGDKTITSDDAMLHLDAVRQVLSMKDRQRLQAFLALDENHDGLLTTRECAPLLSKMRKNASSTFDTKTSDLNQDGATDHMDWNMFQETARLFLNTDSKQEFDAYIRMDSNKDGNITKAESQDAIGALMTGIGAASYEGGLDANADASLTPADAYIFMQTAEKWQID